MKRCIHQLALAFLLAIALNSARASELVDRLVASVDAAPILQSDWNQAIAFEALQQGRSVASFTDKERHDVLERMVDQQLLRAQIGDSQIAATEEREIDKNLEDLRKLYPQATTDEAWHALLLSYGLDEDTVRSKVTAQLEALRFINLRLRPESRATREDIELYYNTVYLREVKLRGGNPEPLEKVTQKIQEILRQQRMDTLLNTWLQELRSHSEIRWLVPVANSISPAKTGEVTN